eukprot:jgi/Ulvmu1/357/UM001_0363.1
MGGSGLAAPASPGDAAALHFIEPTSTLLSATPSGEAFWVGGGYTPPPAAAASAAGDAGWKWYPRLSQNKFGELLLNGNTVSRPFEAGEVEWGTGFPKTIGARFVRIELGSPLESCASLRWPKGSATAVWENFACSGRVVRFFVCRFPNDKVGMEAVAHEATSGSSAAGSHAAAPAAAAVGRKGGVAASELQDGEGGEEKDFWEKLPVERNIAMAIAGGIVGLLLLLCAGCFLAAVRKPAGGKNTTHSQAHITRRALSKKLVAAASSTSRRLRRSREPYESFDKGLCCISSEVYGVGATPGGAAGAARSPRERRAESPTLQCSPYVELPETLGETTVVTVATAAGSPAASGRERGARRQPPGLRGSYSRSDVRASGDAPVSPGPARVDSLPESEEMNWSPPVAIPWLTDSNNTGTEASRHPAEAMHARLPFGPAIAEHTPQSIEDPDNCDDTLMRYGSGGSNGGWRDRQAMSMHRELTDSQFASSPPDVNRHLIREEHARTKKGDVVTRLVYRKSVPRKSSPTSPGENATIPSQVAAPSAAKAGPADPSPCPSTASQHTSHSGAPVPTGERSDGVMDIHQGDFPTLPHHEATAVTSSQTVHTCSNNTSSSTPHLELSVADIPRFSSTRASSGRHSPPPRIDPVTPLDFRPVGASQDSPAPTPSFPTLTAHHQRTRSRDGELWSSSNTPSAPSATPPARTPHGSGASPSPARSSPSPASMLPRPPHRAAPQRSQRREATPASDSASPSPTSQHPGRPNLSINPYHAPSHTSPSATPFPTPTGATGNPHGAEGTLPPTYSLPGSTMQSVPAGAPANAQPVPQRVRGMPISASHAAAIARLHEQLDSHIMNAASGDYGRLDGQYELLGPHERIVGGQGVIQFARLAKGTRPAPNTPEPQVALKFYVQPELIRPESTVYSAPAMHAAGVLPQSGAFALNTDGAMTDSAGAPLPPCFVMERGVSLKEWMARSRLSSGRQTVHSKTAIKAMLHVTQSLASLHQAGFVHRDVKPASILWLPSEHRWALVNFCRATRPGCTTAVPCSLAYAPPEVAAAAGGAAPAVPASTAADSWALGVVVYELFSRQRALDVRGHGMQRVLQQLRGEEYLPWEDPDGPGLRCLGPLAGAVAPMLQRDAARRPDVAAFLEAATIALEGALRPLNASDAARQSSNNTKR